MEDTKNNQQNKGENTEETEKTPEPTVAPEPKDTAEKSNEGKLTKLKGAGMKVPLGPGNFWNNILSTVLLLVLLLRDF